MNPLLIAQIFSCFFMTGLIWLIQVVHYPAFTFVGEDVFKDFHHSHSQRITYIVLPVMTIELLSSIALAWVTPTYPWALNAAGVILLWLATGVLSVPQHNKLGLGKSERVIAKLVLTNWPRTLLWTARSAFLIFYLAGQ